MEETSPTLASKARYGGSLSARRVLLTLSVLSLESILFLALIINSIDVPMYLGIHLAVCGLTLLLGWWWLGRSPMANDPNGGTTMVLQLVAWTAMAGPFGSLLAAGLLPTCDPAAADQASNAVKAKPELSRLDLLHGSLLDRRLRLERAHSIRPLLDVILDGTQIEKLDALSLISKRFVPGLALALKRALEDKDASVRVLAATVMAQQHNFHTKRIGTLQAKARAAPDSSIRWSELGQARLDYAGSGLLETDTAESELRQARSHMIRAEQLLRSNGLMQATTNA
jgi:hypothetical protein